MLDFNAWGVRNMFEDATSQIEQDENLQEMIRSTHSAYVKQLKMARNVKNWD